MITPDMMTFLNIFIRSLFELGLGALLVWGYYNEPKVAAWERKKWRAIKRGIRKLLRKIPFIVAWAEKPAKHGTPDYQFKLDQAEVWSKWSTY